MSSPARPDPDALLARARVEATRAREGRLKVFLGASPGVGKTFAMLEAAQAARAAGLDVVVGVVETHGRAETARLLEGLEVLPRRRTMHRDVALEEFDLDAALARRPALLLVDELAHSNAPGSRHVKRWQDVRELLAAGISVHTTLNIQHLESLNDVVARITGVIVRETVPDAVLDEAGEVELVDVSADVLLQRLRDGKVYFPDQAQRALDRFFGRGNLIALRELALRRTAQQVDAAMLDWRDETGVRQAWPAGERVLVAIPADPAAAGLVRAGWRLATALRGECLVTHVEVPGAERRAGTSRAALQQALQLAAELGARTITAGGSNIGDELLQIARRENVTRVVLGRRGRMGVLARLRRSPIDPLLQSGDGFEIHLVASAPVREQSREPALQPVVPAQPREFLLALAWVAGAAVLGLVLREPLSTTDVAMLFLLAVAVAGARSRPWPGLVAAGSSIVLFDLLFVAPYYTFAVSDSRYFLTFIVMLGVALAVSRLTSRMREHTLAARARERRTAALLDLAQELALATGPAEVATAVRRRLADSLGREATLLLLGDHGGLTPVLDSATALDEKELAVARWVTDHRAPAGAGTATLQGAAARWLPLLVGGRAIGALGVTGPGLDREQQQLLDAIAGQAAVAIERLRLANQTRRDQVEIEAERLRTALLSSLSHDLRTPLAAVEGAVTTLLQTEEHPLDTRRDLLRMVLDEAHRMGRLIQNLLEMVRMESGSLKVRPEWEAVEEIVGLAVFRMRDALAPFTVALDIPPTLPLLRADGLLLEQVLVNLLENAAKYAPAGTTIDIAAQVTGNLMEVIVADRGPGVPPGEEDVIFEKFRRATGTPGGGIGLGLAISRGIVTAHGGTIRAEPRAGGGLRLVVTLPLPETQPLPAEEIAT